MRPDIVIAIDGPAGAGKSTVAKILGQKLGLSLLDTGAMYRCLALTCTREGVTPDQPSKIKSIAENLNIEFIPGTPQQVILDGEDVTKEIRTLEVGMAAASDLSTHPSVREVMVAQQQELIAVGGSIIEGRDVTTVVAPNAPIKIFLTASIEERARRRWLEIRENEPGLRLQQVVRDVVERDHKDYTRGQSPLQLAEDAVIIESYNISPAEIADKIAELARQVT